MTDTRPVLIVTEPALNAEIFKRAWMPPLYRLYTWIYRFRLLSQLDALLAASSIDVVVLASEEVMPKTFSRPRVKVLYYDVESSRVDFKALTKENDRFLSNWFKIKGKDDP